MNDVTLSHLAIPDVQTSSLSSDHARSVAATLSVPFEESEPLPLLWHWAYFLPTIDTDGLGTDGHPPRDGEVLSEFPRRMWVGGDLNSSGPLRLDTTTVRRTRLVSQTRKSGSTGDLLFVALEHTVEQHGLTLVVERQDVVYRPAGSATPAVGPPVDPPTGGDWHETVNPTSALLFRFSAITFNSHRIHYDHEYATRTELYPGLVVHGPLTAMLLARSATRHLSASLRGFAFRASSPLFVDQPVRLTGDVEDSQSGRVVNMTATRVDGVVGMTATARL